MGKVGQSEKVPMWKSKGSSMANARQPKKVVNGKFVNEVRGRSSIGKVGQTEKVRQPKVRQWAS